MVSARIPSVSAFFCEGLSWASSRGSRVSFDTNPSARCPIVQLAYSAFGLVRTESSAKVSVVERRRARRSTVFGTLD